MNIIDYAKMKSIAGSSGGGADSESIFAELNTMSFGTTKFDVYWGYYIIDNSLGAVVEYSTNNGASWTPLLNGDNVSLNTPVGVDMVGGSLTNILDKFENIKFRITRQNNYTKYVLIGLPGRVFNYSAIDIQLPLAYGNMFESENGNVVITPNYPIDKVRGFAIVTTEVLS